MSTLELAALFDQLPNAFMVLDRELRYVAANRAYVRLTGSSLEALLGHYIFERFPDDPTAPSANAAMLRASFERVLATAKPDEVPAIEYRVARTPGGPLEDRIWSARHTPILDDAGRVAFIIQETMDVTHLLGAPPSAAPTQLEATVLERAFEAQSTVMSLDTQLRDLRQMFAQAPGFIAYLHGPAHVFTVANAAYRGLVGHRDVIGMPIAEALPEVVEQGFVSLLDRVYATGEAYVGRDVPVMLQRTASEPLDRRFVDFIYQPIRDASGAVTGVFVQGQDITTQHRAEADAQRTLAELEARSQYEQRLIGIVSHDLRNPLNAISLAGAALAATATDPLVQKMTAIIARASTRATRLIRDLLDFAKKRTGSTIPINPTPTNLREVVEHVVDELKVATPGRTIRVDHSGAEDGSWDADRIAQVISNLVGNALQHGSASAPIVVTSRIDRDCAVLEVTNQGPPISDADLAHLFEPFARATNAAPGAGSLGLGLYIAREVVVAHGGQIDVDSQADTGTRFTVRMPRFAPS